MKKIIAIVATSVILSLMSLGCKSGSSDVQTSRDASTFNQKSYVWESWQPTTNRIEVVR